MAVTHKISNYRPELDGIRALAVIFVIINHFSENILPGGFLGVDIFFVLSGYVVSASLYARPPTHWYAFLSQFYARRMKRIVPALIFCVLVTGFIGCFFIQWPIESLRAGKYSLMGVSNIYFYSLSMNYFGESIHHNLFTHTWSLGIEEQFYLVYPAILVLIGFKAQKRLGITLFALVLASFIFWIWMTPIDPLFSYFLIFSRFWELGLGCLTFLMVLNLNFSGFNKTSAVIAFTALMIICCAVFIPKELLLISNTMVCLAVAALIFFMRKENVVVRMMSNKWMVRIGILSYSLYLWHWPVISLSRHTVGINAYTIFFQILLIILLSLFSFLVIERPFRYGKITKKLMVKDTFTVLAGVSTIAISCLLLMTLKQNSVNKHFSADRPSFDTSKPIFSVQQNFQHCKDSNDVTADVFPPHCYYSAGAPHTLWMIGDSTTWALKGLASKLTEKNGFNIAMFAGDAAFPSTKVLCENGKAGSRCRGIKDFVNETFAYVSKWSKPGDIVLITGNIGHDFCNVPELYCTNNASINDAFYAFLSEMGDLNNILKQKNVRLIISAPLPKWKKDHMLYCERQWFRPSWVNDKCQQPSYAAQKKSRSRLIAIINAAKEKYGFLVYDPFPFVCNKTSCEFSNSKTNENYWIDETHLSTIGGARLAPDFNLFLQSNGLKAPHQLSNRG